MANKTARLGKGINSIFGADVSKVLDDIQNGDVETEAQEQLQIRLEEIRPNPYQPRKVFDPTALEELKDSIQQHGVFTPILVKKSIAGYDLIAGERRLRASKLAGLETMEIALLENIQREDLNVIEEARAYEQLIQKLGYTQEQLAKRVGKSREHITNLLRLLKLPEDVQDYAINKELSMGHIRALLSLKDEMKMRQIAKMAIDQGLSVRKVEQLVKDNGQKKEKTPVEKPEANLFLIEAKKQMEEMFQTSVKISNQTIQIHFENDQDLTRILEILHLIETNE